MQNLRDQYRQLDSTLQGWVHDTDGIAADEARNAGLRAKPRPNASAGRGDEKTTTPMGASTRSS